MAQQYPKLPSLLKQFLQALKVMAGILGLAWCQASPVFATTCANAILIDPASLPIVDQALVCGAQDNLNDETVPGLLCGGGAPLHKNGKEALYKFIPTTSGSYQISFAGQGWSAAMVYIGCPTLKNCLGSFADQTDTGSFSVYLNAGTAYFIWFDAWPDSETEGPCPGAFSFGPPPTSNDDPCGATPLAVNTDMACAAETPGTLADATQTFGVTTSPCAGNPNDDVWFKFTATGPTHYIFLNDVAGNTTDLVLGVYSGPCTALTNIRCIHALNTSVTDLIPGNTYWVRVFSYSSNPANTTFDVCVTTPPPPPICGEMFYDNGGPSANYVDNTDVVTTICPSTPGDTVSLVFSTFDLDFSDGLTFFDGNSTAAPYMDAYYGDDVLPLTVTATNSTGCLTAAFYSDHDENYAGWAAQVICKISTLPVELISLQAKPRHTMVDVTWATATEQNSDYFEVQRSPDDVHFAELGTVSAAGDADGRHDYYFTDPQPFQGANYYRLKQVDRDGAYSITNTVVAFIGGSKVPVLFPNPVGDILNVAFETPVDGDTRFAIFDALGQLQRQTTVNAVHGAQTMELAMAGLAAGIYNLQITLPSGEELHSSGFLKR